MCVRACTHVTAAHLGYGVVELLHVVAEETAKARQDLSVPGVVLQSDLLLDLAVVDLNRAKALHGVSGVDGLTGFPSRKKSHHMTIT